MLDHVKILEAVDFAARKHKDQRRLDSTHTPYINHPVGVANILAQEGGRSFFVIDQVIRTFQNIIYWKIK